MRTCKGLHTVDCGAQLRTTQVHAHGSLCCGWCQGRVLGVVFGVVVDGASVVGAGPGSGWSEVPMTGDRSAALD